MVREVRVGDAIFGGGRPLVLIAGPCVIESLDHTLRTAEALKAIAARLGIGLVFKASYDKANRTSVTSFRGPGIEAGLEILARVKSEFGLPVLSDVHDIGQVAPAAEVLDVLQIPAFLSRQTDLLAAAGATGRVVNVKKGQFLAPWDMKNVVGKLEADRQPRHPAHRARRLLRLQQPGGRHAFPADHARHRLPGDLRRHPLGAAARRRRHGLRRSAPVRRHPVAGGGGRRDRRALLGGPRGPRPGPVRRPQQPPARSGRGAAAPSPGHRRHRQGAPARHDRYPRSGAQSPAHRGRGGPGPDRPHQRRVSSGPWR